MRRIFILVLTCIIFSAFTPRVAAQTEQSMSSNYVIFRANISPLYIENESIIVQVLAIAFQNNKPTADTTTVHIEITGLNVEYNYEQSYTVHSGRKETLYLPPLYQGHYDMLLYASWNGIKSKVVDQDFGVTKPPIPYSLAFSDDGSHIYFKSLKLNESGVPDPHFPFRLEIYQYTHGSGESLVTTYSNVTEITITVPASWKNGILYVEVVDCYGWRNSATINLAKMQFQGVPISYDYLYYEREPFRSRQPYYIAIAVILLIIAIVALWRWQYAAG